MRCTLHTNIERCLQYNCKHFMEHPIERPIKRPADEYIPNNGYYREKFIELIKERNQLLKKVKRLQNHKCLRKRKTKKDKLIFLSKKLKVIEENPQHVDNVWEFFKAKRVLKRVK